jgi:hypothetical protein
MVYYNLYHNFTHKCGLELCFSCVSIVSQIVQYWEQVDWIWCLHFLSQQFSCRLWLALPAFKIWLIFGFNDVLVCQKKVITCVQAQPSPWRRLLCFTKTFIKASWLGVRSWVLHKDHLAWWQFGNVGLDLKLSWFFSLKAVSDLNCKKSLPD